MIGDALNLAIGCLEFVLAVVVVRHVWRFRRGFPWLIALTAFFLLRGVDRVLVAFAEKEPAVLGVLVDALVLLILVLLVFAMERLVHGLELASTPRSSGSASIAARSSTTAGSRGIGSRIR
jgi:hypothetical protein